MILHAKFHDSRLVNVKCIENIVVCFLFFRGRVIVFCSKLHFHCTLASQVNQRCMCGLFSAFLQQMLINTEHVFHDVVMHYWHVCWLILCWLLVLTTNRMTLVLCLSSWCALYAMLYRSVSISNCLLCALCLCVCVCLCKPLCCLECLPAFPAIQNLSSCAMCVYWRLVALPTCCAKQNLCNSLMSILPASLLLSARWTEIPIDCCTVSAWKQWQANASSAMLSAYIVSWTQTCFCVFVSCLECCPTSAVLFICKIRRKEQGWKHMSCLWRVIKHARQPAVSVAHAWYCAISAVDCRVKVCSVHVNWTEQIWTCSVFSFEHWSVHRTWTDRAPIVPVSLQPIKLTRMTSECIV